jgi:hypothetical protein
MIFLKYIYCFLQVWVSKFNGYLYGTLYSVYMLHENTSNLLKCTLLHKYILNTIDNSFFNFIKENPNNGTVQHFIICIFFSFSVL